MDAEKGVEYTREEGQCVVVKVLQCPVRYTVRTRSLADLETPNDFLNLVGVFNWVSLPGLKTNTSATLQLSQ